jgi:hypothetical protein
LLRVRAAQASADHIGIESRIQSPREKNFASPEKFFAKRSHSVFLAARRRIGAEMLQESRATH